MAVFDLNRAVVNGQLPDISTAGASYIYVTKDMEGHITQLAGVLGGAITTGDATVTLSVNGTSVGTITVANAGSAEGDTDTLEPTSGHAVSEGDWIKVATDGGSTNAVPWGFSVEITR